MHEMMDAGPGPGTSARMHRADSAEEMMKRCSDMMTMMERMMDEGMMDGMEADDMGGMMEMMQR